jgi:hypothetical protein
MSDRKNKDGSFTYVHEQKMQQRFFFLTTELLEEDKISMQSIPPEIVQYARRVECNLGPVIVEVADTMQQRIRILRKTHAKLLQSPDADPRTVRMSEHALRENETDIAVAFAYECAAEALEQINTDLEMSVSVESAGEYLHRERLLTNERVFPSHLLEDPSSVRMITLRAIAGAAAERTVADICDKYSEHDRHEIFRLLTEQMSHELLREAMAKDSLPMRSDDDLF